MDENMLMNVASGGAPTTDYFYAQDGLGTIRQIFDASHSLVNNYDYEGFGTNSGKSETIYNRFRYTGREFDEETESTFTLSTSMLKNDGLHYYRARTYDTSVGSFTSRDPIPARNLYPYCAANPINFTDPTGNMPDYNQQYEEETKCPQCTENFTSCIFDKIENIALNALKDLSNLRAFIDCGLPYPEFLLFDPDLFIAVNRLIQENSFFDYRGNGFRLAGLNPYCTEQYNLLETIETNLATLLFRMKVAPPRLACYFSDGVLGWAHKPETQEKYKNSAYYKSYGNSIGINMATFCFENELGNYQTGLIGKGIERQVAAILTHELTHFTFGSHDGMLTLFTREFGRLDIPTPIYLRSSNCGSELMLYDQIGYHADTYLRYLMQYYEDLPECKLDPECCIEILLNHFGP